MNISEQKNDDSVINIAYYLKKNAHALPHKRAVVYPAGKDKSGRVAYAHLTFKQLDHESDIIAYGLNSVGINKGTRTIIMVNPSIDFFTLIFALFKTGAVPVVVDPGMGIKRMLVCFAKSSPEAFIGIPKAHILRIIRPKTFKNIKTFITVGKRWLWSGYTLNDIRINSQKPYKIAATGKDDLAAILFTTGSTGPAKGVEYTHGIFDTQVNNILSCFDIQEDEIDLPTFPLFALFDPALGITAVIPDIDPTKPALADPEKIIEPIINQGVTNMFASPALLNNVGRYAKEKNIKFPSLKRVVSAGAPVSLSNIKVFSSLLPKGSEIHTPYGATEAMPISSIKSDEILKETGKLSDKGYGICVGRPIDDIQVAIIKIDDSPIKKWSDSLLLPDGEIGEIVAKGDNVTKHYFNHPLSEIFAKIKDNNSFWHRMGDLGWSDSKGRIWYCGRKSHRVITENETFYTIPCELIFNTHPKVFRSALIGVGPKSKQNPVICIELENDKHELDLKRTEKEILEIASDNIITKNINKVLFHNSFPVDIRHNSKIFREKLVSWADQKLNLNLFP